jgi:anti-sigma factor RsiW
MQGCDGIRDRLLDFIDGELGVDDHREIEAHLSRCPACSRLARALGETVARVRALPESPVPDGLLEGFAAAVQRRIANEQRRRVSFWRRITTWLGDFPGLRPLPALSAAAALGLLLAIGLVHTSRAPQPSPVTEVALVGESISIAQNLDLLEQFDLLEDLDLLEQLPILRAPGTGVSLRLS